MDLLPNVYRARTLKILSPALIRVELDVGFGTLLRRRIQIEGVRESSVPKSQRSKAEHALIVTLGGKELFVQLDPHAEGSIILGRVFLNSKLPADSGPWMLPPSGLSNVFLEVGAFMDYVASKSYDIDVVLGVINRKR